MELHKRLDLITGWIVFGIATLVYVLTVEPTAGWWDCGEYIATSYKLQISHPPGAPFFQLVGRFFSLFAFGDTSKVALMVNIMSALSSSFTILFLFWTITHFARKIVVAGGEMTEGKNYAIIGSGVVGALAYTFTDSFWFSAVEGEVYAMSSFFTALVFWCMLKWEEEKDDRYALHWLILIAYLVGLSIGVHLLNLLAIPAISYIYYFKKHKPTLKGIVLTGIVSILILAVIMNGIIPWVVRLSSVFELTFVNSFGLPFNTGTWFYFAILIAGIVWALRYTSKKKKVILNTIVLSFTFLLIGYSSFFTIIIRSNVNPPIDQNSPDDAISLLGYLAREQYGDWPILHGPYYNAPTIALEDGKPVYVKDYEKGRYVITDHRKSTKPVYDPRFTTIFPRMWSNQKSSHIDMYKQYGKVKGIPIEVTTDEGSEIRMRPTFGENLRYFFTYQIGHMYFRYFMWNFSGRQNDVESQGEIENGNWITGINWFDEHVLRLGPQDNLPDSMKSASRNRFYMLPFLLGLIGLFYHLKQHKKDTWVVALLFVMTGLAIIVYLNQYPYQPRERDYAYAASFYAFAIWIGLGVMAIFDVLQKKINPKLAAIAATTASLLLVPVIMAKEGWDDHDRSGRYATRDFAINYLESCEPNAILFTNGDNDTFPLWYAQEVEGIRPDVRVVNFMLASGHWYIHQMMTKAYESEALPFTLSKAQYENGVNNAVVFYDQGVQGHIELKQIIDFIANENERTKIGLTSGERINFSPTKNFKLTNNPADLIRRGVVPEHLHDKIVPSIEWTVRQNYLYKNDLMLLDMIATNNWERPIYFANPSSVSRVLNVTEYCHLEGFVYRFLPVKAEHFISGVGGVNPHKTYDLYLNTFKWGNLNAPGVHVDRESFRNSIIPKQNFMRTARAMVELGENEKAIELLDKALEEFPDEKITFDMYMIPFIEVYYDAGANEKANTLAERVFEIYNQNIEYYNRLNPALSKYYENEYSQALAVMQQLGIMARGNQQDELYQRIDSTFRYYLEMFE
jgi:tetratricopeptide (TPR) repeat protein